MGQLCETTEPARLGALASINQFRVLLLILLNTFLWNIFFQRLPNGIMLKLFSHSVHITAVSLPN